MKKIKLVELLSVVMLILHLSLFIITIYFLVDYFNNLIYEPSSSTYESFNFQIFEEIKNWYSF